MSIQTPCACGHTFAVADALAGGLCNCPRCGKATRVPGFHDPFWRWLQVLALLGVIATGVAVALTVGPFTGILAAVGLALGLWLLSRAF